MARSVGVGGVATVVDASVLLMLATGFGLGPRVASPIALFFGVLVQFAGNKWFAFEDFQQAWSKQAVPFLAVELCSFAANLAVFDFAVRALVLPIVLLRLLSQALVYFGVSLPLWTRIFRAPANEAVR